MESNRTLPQNCFSILVHAIGASTSKNKHEIFVMLTPIKRGITI